MYMGQNRVDDVVFRYNDPRYHKPVFFRALDNAVLSGSLKQCVADKLRREY